jgi:hypothetical protein
MSARLRTFAFKPHFRSPAGIFFRANLGREACVLRVVAVEAAFGQILALGLRRTEVADDLVDV